MKMKTIALGLLVPLVLPAPLAAQELQREWAATRYEASLFGDETDTWHYGSVEVGARRTRLTPIARVNWASRFEQEGYQLETELYPAWPGLGYATLTAAWSKGAPFPELRASAEAFASLPDAFEASAGVIYMDFEADDVATIVGSLSKYVGNYWLAARPSFTTGSGDLAVTLVTRRYLRSAGEFLTLRVLSGRTAEEVIARGNTSLETIGLQADAQLEVTRSWLVLPLAGIAREEIPGGDARTRYSLGVGAMYRF